MPYVCPFILINQHKQTDKTGSTFSLKKHCAYAPRLFVLFCWEMITGAATVDPEKTTMGWGWQHPLTSSGLLEMKQTVLLFQITVLDSLCQRILVYIHFNTVPDKEKKKTMGGIMKDIQQMGNCIWLELWKKNYGKFNCS